MSSQNTTPNASRWGVIGPGSIAGRFAEALTSFPDARLVAVAGRSQARADAFAKRWSARDAAARVYRTVEELVAADDVDAVYIATPHSAHAAGAELALAAGKPVLCEKPMTASARAARALIEQARARRVFLMEALWTRFLPAYAIVAEWLHGGAIGRVHTLRSNFCFTLRYDASARHFDPAQAGGALLDVGVYNLSVSRWVAAATGAGAIATFDVEGRCSPTGVDVRSTVSLVFENGLSSHFTCAFDGDADNAFTIEGDRGTITIPAGFWQADAAVLQREGHRAERRSAPFRVNGFEYQLEEARRCITAGAIESAVIPHAETLATLELLDALRGRLGVRYPFE